MNAPEQPAWDLLPHDPQAFFELSDEYDRKDLKRKYNRLIRVFKPERHPEEFQRIRAAYEQLDNALRYGDRFRPKTVTDFVMQEWQQPEEAPDEQTADQQSFSSRQTTITQQLTETSPQTVYRELNSKDDKTPYDYYALAVLSDVVTPDDPLGFFRWLLNGLKASPNDPAFFELLESYLRSPIELKQIPKILQATAKVIRDDRFYYLTERL